MSESRELVETSQFDVAPRYDSPETLSALEQDREPSLGKYTELREIKNWMSTSAEKRLSPNAVERAIMDVRAHFGNEDRIEILRDTGQTESDEFIHRRSMLNLCDMALKELRENENGKIRNLMENFKVHGLAHALQDDTLKGYLEDNAYNAEAIDYAVTAAVLQTIGEVVTQDTSQNANPSNTFSNN